MQVRCGSWVVDLFQGLGPARGWGLYECKELRHVFLQHHLNHSAKGGLIILRMMVILLEVMRYPTAGYLIKAYLIKGYEVIPQEITV